MKTGQLCVHDQRHDWPIARNYFSLPKGPLSSGKFVVFKT